MPHYYKIFTQSRKLGNPNAPTHSSLLGGRYVDFMFVGYVTFLHALGIALAVKEAWFAIMATALVDVVFVYGYLTTFILGRKPTPPNAEPIHGEKNA
jgi:hypothetical protein